MWRLLSVFYLVGFGCLGAPKQVTILTDKNFYPYSYVDDSEVAGLYPEIVRAVDEQLKDYNITLIGKDWQLAKQDMRTGDALALLSVYYHGHDWPYMYPYSQPFAQETIVTVCAERVLTKPRPKWPSDYQGLLVANISGYDGWLNDEVRTKDNTDVVNFLEVPSTEIALKMVVKDKIDCALFEQVAFAHSLMRLKTAGDYVEGKDSRPVIGATLNTETVHLGYSAPALKGDKFPFAADFQKQFDNALYRLRKSGELDAITAKFKQPGASLPSSSD